MELRIGSNVIRNTSGVLNVRGDDQIHLEIGPNDDQLLLTADVYDADQKHVAKLRRNAWAFNAADRYEITTAPSSLTLIERDSGLVLLEAKVLGKDVIEVPRGRFYTKTGVLVEITPEFWRLGGMTMSGNTFDSVGGAVGMG